MSSEGDLISMVEKTILRLESHDSSWSRIYAKKLRWALRQFHISKIRMPKEPKWEDAK